MINVHDSTLALSVYNAVKECGAMTPQQVITHLRRRWERDFDADDLGKAIAYLKARGMVTAGDTIAPTRLVDGVAATVVRKRKRETELIYGVRT